MYKFVGKEICEINDAKVLNKAIIWIIEIKATPWNRERELKTKASAFDKEKPWEKIRKEAIWKLKKDEIFTEVE